MGTGVLSDCFEMQGRHKPWTAKDWANDSLKHSWKKSGTCPEWVDSITGLTNWHIFQGKMPLEDYNKSGNRLYVALSHDHLFATGHLPLKDWIFTHRQLPVEYIEKVLPIDDLKLCNINTVSKLHKAATKVMDVLYGLKVRY